MPYSIRDTTTAADLSPTATDTDLAEYRGAMAAVCGRAADVAEYRRGLVTFTADVETLAEARAAMRRLRESAWLLWVAGEVGCAALDTGAGRATTVAPRVDTGSNRGETA
jgi:hypothetical protein